MKKRLTKFIALLMSLVVCFGATACSSKNAAGSDDPQTLDIYLLYKGYGKEWLEGNIELFKNQDWVKDKYPDLQVNFLYDANDINAREKITNGASVNKFDVLFGVNLKGFESTGLIADLTDSVYLAEVPGESGVKVIDKVPDNVKQFMYRVDAPARADGNESFYAVNYIDGLMGMLYNHDILVEQLKMEIPLTTEQFLSVGAEIQSKKYSSHRGEGLDTVIISCPDNSYWNTTFNVWWTQYEGYEGYVNYFDGYDPVEDKKPSTAIFDQEGRLEALKTIETILSKYGYENKNSAAYKTIQTDFLYGNGVFHYNGDYFSSEMQIEIETMEKEGKRYDIRYMKMPVISSIVETLDLYTHGDKDYYNDLTDQERAAYDKTLQSIIKEIDADKLWADSQSKIDGIKKSDYEKVAEARQVSASSAASGQVAVVPEYSPAKALAADFLRFMYSDMAIENFARTSKGIIFPTTYDIKGNTELYDSFDPISKSKLELAAGTSNYPMLRLPANDATKLGSAGLTALFYNGKFEVNFILDEDQRISPEDIIAAEKDHWNGTAWEQMIGEAKY